MVVETVWIFRGRENSRNRARYGRAFYLCFCRPPPPKPWAMASRRLCDILARSWGMCSNGQRYSDGNRAARARGFQLGLLGVAGQAAQCIGALTPIAGPIALMCHSFAGVPPMAVHSWAMVSWARSGVPSVSAGERRRPRGFPLLSPAFNSSPGMATYKGGMSGVLWIGFSCPSSKPPETRASIDFAPFSAIVTACPSPSFQVSRRVLVLALTRTFGDAVSVTACPRGFF